MRFIRLKETAINISHISKICIHKDKYTIHLNDFKPIGELIFASGEVYTTYTKIDICKIKNYPDWFHITNFLYKGDICY